MIPYLGCDAARTCSRRSSTASWRWPIRSRVESHLRWCETCGARVEDMRLIGASLRVGAQRSTGAPDEVRALTAVQAEVLTRIRAEHDQSFRMRVREMFEDMRFFWPALGATGGARAPASCTAVSVLHAATGESDSMAGGRWNRPPTPARDPHAAGCSKGVPEEEAVFALATMVTRGRRIADYETAAARARERAARATAPR